MQQIPHKEFLNNFFTGSWQDSFSRGELYNNDPITRDARFCGTTASMCGVEKAGYCGDDGGMVQAIRLDLMLHAFMLFQAGIPVIYSGDEVGQVNDYTYKEDPDKMLDSRYIHRGAFQWHLADNIDKEGTVQNQLFNGLRQLETIRQAHEAFGAGAQAATCDSCDSALLYISRTSENEKLLGIFNFSQAVKILDWTIGGINLVTGGDVAEEKRLVLRPYDFVWLKLEKTE